MQPVWNPGPTLALAGATLLAALTLCASPLDRPAQGPPASHPERLAERFVTAWRTRDRASLTRLAEPPLVQMALWGPEYAFPEDTPASEGPLLHLSGAENGADGGLALLGELRWGPDLRKLRLEVSAGGRRLRAMRWHREAHGEDVP